MSRFQGDCVAVCGTNGTGKTTYADEVARAYIDRGLNALILVPDDDEEIFDPYHEIQPYQIGNFRGGAKCIVDEDNLEDVFATIAENFGGSREEGKGGIIIIDDALAVISERPGMKTKYVFKRRRQLGLDIMMITHSFNEFPVSLVKNIKDILLFQTVDAPYLLRNRISNFKNFETAISYVNSKCQSDQYFNFRYNLKFPPKFN